MMESEWMYGLNRVTDLWYLDEVRKFVVAVISHCEKIKRTNHMSCSHYMNLKARIDGKVQSHLIRSCVEPTCINILT